jgi:hypothetical protein
MGKAATLREQKRKQWYLSEPHVFGRFTSVINGVKKIVDGATIESYLADPELFNWIKETLPNSQKGIPDRLLEASLLGLKDEIFLYKDTRMMHLLFKPECDMPIAGLSIYSGRFWVNHNYPKLLVKNPNPKNATARDIEKAVTLWKKSLWD